MELRRFEALANLSQGNTKVIFDLAKPYDDVRHTAAAMAEAAATEGQKVRVDGPRAGQAQLAPNAPPPLAMSEAQREAAAIAEAQAALESEENARRNRVGSR
jgi:hypothetical protein